jgi:O-succinylbenzoic acid--CoA ligase
VDVSTADGLVTAERAIAGALDGGTPVLPLAGPEPGPAVAAQEVEGVAAVVATSGSSGTPKHVLLSARALRTSGEATLDHLGGPGQWLLALPAQHVAGFQVLCRSVLAGTSPVALPPGAPFTVEAFAAAVARMRRDVPRYASLVPTQLTRLLRHPSGVAALGDLDAVLVGGAALPAPVADLVRQHRLPVVTTYGMTETSGGCVYDGRPLRGVRVELADGRIRLGGPVVAQGYLGLPDLTRERFATHGGTRWYLTDDAGQLEDDLLRVLGRVDDVINTGAHKVDPVDVVAALLRVPGVRAAHVEGVPDEEWGQLVAAAVVPDGPVSLDPEEVRGAVRGALPAHAVPRRVVLLESLPLLPSGKPDRLRLRHLLACGGGTI